MSKSTASVIQNKRPGFYPKIGLVLGSGLSALATRLQNATVIPYQSLPGFDECTVSGHESNVYLGTLHNTSIVCLQGRFHAYEKNGNALLHLPIQTLKWLGCEALILTNTVGSLNPNLKPGDLALINDHINFTFFNPLVGKNDPDIGPRFPNMTNAYDADLRTHFKATARQLSISLTEGVYIGTLGPSFETPAEIRAFRLLGADVVGMSGVPEVILARHCGLRVVALSVITNMAAGLSDQTLDHQVTLEWANHSKENLMHLIASSLIHFPFIN